MIFSGTLGIPLDRPTPKNRLFRTDQFIPALKEWYKQGDLRCINYGCNFNPEGGYEPDNVAATITDINFDTLVFHAETTNDTQAGALLEVLIDGDVEFMPLSIARVYDATFEKTPVELLMEIKLIGMEVKVR